MNLIYERLTPTASAPRFAHPGDACFDIAADLPDYKVGAVIYPGKRGVISTGLRFDIPQGYVLKVYSRSGHGFKSSVVLGNGTGIIDSGYTGELKVCLLNEGNEPFIVRHGDRIAQGMLARLLNYNLTEGSVDKSTERGANGFGSSK